MKRRSALLAERLHRRRARKARERRARTVVTYYEPDGRTIQVLGKHVIAMWQLEERRADGPLLRALKSLPHSGGRTMEIPLDMKPGQALTEWKTPEEMRAIYQRPNEDPR